MSPACQARYLSGGPYRQAATPTFFPFKGSLSRGAAAGPSPLSPVPSHGSARSTLSRVLRRARLGAVRLLHRLARHRQEGARSASRFVLILEGGGTEHSPAPSRAPRPRGGTYCAALIATGNKAGVLRPAPFLLLTGGSTGHSNSGRGPLFVLEIRG